MGTQGTYLYRPSYGAQGVTEFSAFDSGLASADAKLVTLNSHASSADHVHGITGQVVGTNDTQTLSSKTFSGGVTVALPGVSDSIVLGVDGTITGNVGGIGPYFRFNTGGVSYINGGNVGIGIQTPTNQLSLGYPNGQQLGFDYLTELVTIAASVSSSSTIQIPAHAIALAVSTRVTVAIPTATTFSVGIDTFSTYYGTGISTASDTTSKGTGPFYAPSVDKCIIITPNLTPVNNTGRVRLTIHYINITPPTS
jgi:hypothetical protein